jgi:ankyrin repeat protein
VNCVDVDGDEGGAHAGFSTLIWAIKNKLDTVAAQLIARGADLNHVSEKGKSPLDFCTSGLLGSNVPMALKALKARGGVPGPEAVVLKGNELVAACKSGDEGGALAALQAGADINSGDGTSFAVIYAAGSNLGAVIDAFVDRGANLDRIHKDTKQTALIVACICGFDEVAVKLVQGGANVSLKDKDGKKAASYASEAKTPATVKALKEADI